ncbi:diguanylate cyclase, partial [Pelomonas sp. KK5]|uniref:diguanylate cyclase n=1 Tax=Pelomonas sp. KK5 TaxID=1855730 RepID=UPI00097C872C
HKPLAVATAAVLLLSSIALMPWASQPLAARPDGSPAGAATLLAQLLLAALLFGRGATERDAGAARLGGAFLFVATLFLVSLIPAAGDGAAWLWTARHAGFALLVLRQLRTPSGSAPRPAAEAGLALALAGALAALAVLGPAPSPRSLLFIDAMLLALQLLVLVLLARRPRHGPPQLWLGVMLVAAWVEIWLVLQGAARDTLGGQAAAWLGLAAALAMLVALFVETHQLYRRYAQDNERLQGLARTDGLTALANRRRFDEALAAEWSRAFRAERPMTLLMVDIDRFKAFNDRHGHAEGDQCLRRVAQLLQRCARRPGDTAARYGGEEFALVLPDTDQAGAAVVASLLRRELAALAIAHEDAPEGRLTLSIGIAQTQAQQTGPLDLLHAADAALYAAKRDGRDRACFAPPSSALALPA